jgi:hypothetical protein
LEEGGAVLEGADCCLAAKEVGRRAFHKLKAVPVGVVEGKNDTRVDFTGEVFFTAKPSRLGENATTGADPIFHKF